MNEKDYNFVLSEVKLLKDDGDSFTFVMPITARGKTAIFVEVFDNSYRIEANDIVDGCLEPIGCISCSGAEYGDWDRFMREFSEMYNKLMNPFYYDVVCSVYAISERREGIRVDALLIGSGYSSIEEAESHVWRMIGGTRQQQRIKRRIS